MTEQTRIILMLVLVMSGYLLGALALAGRLLRPAARRLLAVFLLIAVFIISMHLPTRDQPGFWRWFFHPSSELAAGAIFSSLQYVLALLTALLIGLLGRWPRLWHRFYWLILAGLFAFLCADEYFALHESVLLWRYLYPLAGAAAVSLTVLAWALTFRRDWWVVVLMVIGFGIMGFSGVALDAFSNEQLLRFGSYEVTWFACNDHFLGLPCQSYGFAEEFLEMAGVTLILATLLSYLLVKAPPEAGQRIRRVLVVGAALWLAWTVANPWLIPSVEALLPGTQRVALTYADDGLRLLGYRQSTDSVAPGGAVDIAIYFRADRPLTQDYHLSVHALSRPDAESVAQADIQLGEWQYPSSAWIPGLAVRNRVRLEFPADLPTDPASYRIALRVWYPDAPRKTLTMDELNGLLIVDSARPLVTPDTVDLFGLAVLTPTTLPEPPTPADYRFTGGLTLAGYDLPQTATPGGTLPLAFWWRTGDRLALNADMVQFIHLFHSNGQDYWVYDRPPFGDRFPTSDWPGGVTLRDSVSVPLPADLPPGEYTVRTGLYEPVNRDRLVVTDSGGTVVTDYSIILGKLTLAGPPESDGG